jgi:hypothetical protein
MTIKSTGPYTFTGTMLSFNVKNISDSAWMYAEQHWIGAERSNSIPSGIRLSSERYWTISGIWPADFQATATINYDGRPAAYGLDSALTIGKEDSIVLLYRGSANDNWTLLKADTDYTKFMGSSTDRYGSLRINNLKQGQYSFGRKDYKAGIATKHKKQGNLLIYPNPAGKELNIQFNEPTAIRRIKMYDMSGKEVYDSVPEGKEAQYVLQTARLSGMYLIKVITETDEIAQKVLVENR